jgi:hypothetical protein
MCQDLVETAKRNVLKKLTCFTSEPPILPTLRTFQAQVIMPQPQQPLLYSSKADMQLTISSFDRNQIKAVRVVGRTFNVPRTMLRDRRAGVPVQSLYGKFYDQRLRWRKKARTSNGSHQLRSYTTRSLDKGVQPRHDAHGSHQRDGRKGRIPQVYRSHQ